jgi:3-hydroxyacyl-[acyl-carrier-protein] dehydratase
MILLGDFFTIASLAASGPPVDPETLAPRSNDSGPFTVQATLDINPAHRIFEGHFPGQPIVPGVCMMQMVKEVLETAIGKETRLVSAVSAKFLYMIDPRETSRVSMELICRPASVDPVSADPLMLVHPAEEITLEGKLFKEATIYLKYKARFRIIRKK